MAVEIKCTEEAIDVIVSKMEASLLKVEELQGKKVKLKPAEVDLLIAFEEARDYMQRMLGRESKETLQNIFGGDCKRIAAIDNCLKNAHFSDVGTQNDQRIQGCKDACESVLKVLEDLGFGWALRQAQAAAARSQRSKSVELMAEEVAELQSEVVESVIVEAPRPPPSKKDPSSQALENTLDENLISRILACTEPDQLAEFGDLERKVSLGNWMIWMVHRAHLNDPTLFKFDFSNLVMPRPKDEPRIAPKLCKAMSSNTHIQELLLPNSNFQTRAAGMLAESLKQNCTLKKLNLDSNFIQSAEMESLINAIGVNQSLEEVRFNNQGGLKLGTAHYEALAKAVQANTFLLKVGCQLDNQFFNNTIQGQLTKNNDAARRRRNAAKQEANEGGYPS